METDACYDGGAPTNLFFLLRFLDLGALRHTSVLTQKLISGEKSKTALPDDTKKQKTKKWPRHTQRESLRKKKNGRPFPTISRVKEPRQSGTVSDEKIIPLYRRTRHPWSGFTSERLRSHVSGAILSSSRC